MRKIVFYIVLIVLILISARIIERKNQLNTTRQKTYESRTTRDSLAEPTNDAEKITVLIHKVESNSSVKVDAAVEKIHQGEEKFRKAIDKISQRNDFK